MDHPEWTTLTWCEWVRGITAHHSDPRPDIAGVRPGNYPFERLLTVDKLRVGVTSGEVTQDKKMSRCYLPKVVYHQVYNVDRPRVRSHEERRRLFEEPTQSRISPSLLHYTKNTKINSDTTASGSRVGASGCGGSSARQFRRRSGASRCCPNLI